MFCCSLTSQIEKFIDSEMIIINQDEVAFYWRFSEEYGHISRFKRLDIDRFVYGNDAITFSTPTSQSQ